MDPKKIAAHPVGRLHRTEVLVIILMQLASGMQPNLVPIRGKYIMPFVVSFGLLG
jgi:hypothetical protein